MTWRLGFDIGGTFTDFALGGGAGEPGRIVLNPDTADEQVMHSKAIYPLAHGDLVSLRVSGSGGYGDPLARDPAMVVRDVTLGYVSAEQGRERYGVVLDAAGEVSVEATVARRADGPRGRAEHLIESPKVIRRIPT